MSVTTAAAAFTFQADVYCPDCIVPAMAKTEEYDGWQVAEGIHIDIEENLDEIAAAFGVDREDENSFDSDDFPKTVSSEHADGEKCGGCREII